MPLIVAILIGLGFYIWQTVPFTAIFKHLTLSEYFYKKNYLHTFFTH
jgi:hypothetical protein